MHDDTIPETPALRALLSERDVAMEERDLAVSRLEALGDENEELRGALMRLVEALTTGKVLYTENGSSIVRALEEARAVLTDRQSR